VRSGRAPCTFGSMRERHTRGGGRPVHVVAWSRRGTLLFQFWGEALWLLRIICRHVRVLAVVVMPDHVHVVLADGADLAALRRALGTWARARNRMRGASGPAWRGKLFVEEIRDPRHLDKLLVYVHRNPVPKGLVTDPLAWPASTYRDALGLTISPLVVPFPDPERHHALVSSGRKVVRGMIEGGTPLPAGRPGPAAFREVVAAVCAATRRLPAELLRPGPARDLLVHVASRRTELSRARVAAWLRRDPAVVSRVLARPVPGAAIRSVERLLGDPRFPLLRATEDLARRPGWAEYRSRALSLDPPGQPGRHLLRQVLGRGA